MNNILSERESTIVTIILKLFIVLGTFFIISLNTMIVAEFIGNLNNITRMILLFLCVSLSLISILSSISIYKKIK